MVIRHWGKFLLTGVLSVSVLSACGQSEGGSGSPQEEVVQVGATQIVEHPSLDAAYEGFKQGLADNGYTEGENIEYDMQNAQDDISNAQTIANNFISTGKDLIFANSTPSAQAALKASSETPIVFTSVTDAMDAGLIESPESPGELITGVMDLHPEAISMTVDFISENFPGASVGMVYNSGEQNSVTQVEEVKAAMEGTDLTSVTRSVSSSAEVKQAAESLAGEADVMYIVTDNTVVSALESVVGVANEQDIPMVVSEPDSLERGGFVTYGINYEQIGHRAGEMAARILDGEASPSDIPAEYPQEMQLMINKKAASEQGVEIKEAWEEEAEFINE
ncbi:ABC transporter substrate-binding protein [Salibacterium halotolerans]|uniref:Putative ABC transport system substrate-binding protein n=1 Tax=Salibacterium halotolerans TaxID=1884432 RepID=A0A1I5T5F4_9BACI|nr:ABC transporter substrate-binding protein [Salibacterium halotolerans]SFP78243.1 putative ABC transport system substrate-binding protein [Salibacterium halotolerans]